VTTFHVLAALFAVYMLVRHGPRAIRLARSREHRGGALVPLVNVALAVVILAYAVKELVSGLISR
jgi:hypothetical protein